MKFPCLDEEMAPGIITGIMGRMQAGKSLYAWEVGCTVLKNIPDSEILYISTEEGSDYFIKAWKEKLEKKYGIKLKYRYMYVPLPIDLLKKVGIQGQIVGKSSKAKTKKEEGEEEEEKQAKVTKNEFIKTGPDDIGQSEIYSILKNSNISCIIIDSVSAAFNSLILGGMQNFPLRAATEEVFLLYLMQIANSVPRPIYIFTTHHISFDPTMMFATIAQSTLKGGVAVGHHVKMLFAIEKSQDFMNTIKHTIETRKGTQTESIPMPAGARNLWVTRYPSIAEWQKVYLLQIDENGFRRSTDQERSSIKKKLAENREIVGLIDVQ